MLKIYSKHHYQLLIRCNISVTIVETSTAQQTVNSKQQSAVNVVKGSTKEFHPQRKSVQQATHNVTEDLDDYTMYNLAGVSIKSLKVTVKVNNADLDMEVDTGASVLIIIEDT